MRKYEDIISKNIKCNILLYSKKENVHETDEFCNECLMVRGSPGIM